MYGLRKADDQVHFLKSKQVLQKVKPAEYYGESIRDSPGRTGGNL